MNKKLLTAGALALAAFGAQAQTAGTWFGGVAITRISPNTQSGTLSPPAAPNTTVDVGGDTKPTLFIGRMITDHWSVALPIGFGFKSDITGTGGIAGVGKIGTVHSLPITLFGQYRFLEPQSRFRPYAMLGLTYAYFYDAHGSATLDGVNPANRPGSHTGLKVDSRFGLTPGVGMTWSLTDRVFLDLQYAHSFLRTTTTLSTGQTISTRLNPDVFRVAVGMRF